MKIEKLLFRIPDEFSIDEGNHKHAILTARITREKKKTSAMFRKYQQMKSFVFASFPLGSINCTNKSDVWLERGLLRGDRYGGG